MLVSRPEIFCWILDGRRSRSAWFEVGGTCRSWAKRSTSAGRSRRTSSSSRALRSPRAGAAREGVGQPDQHADVGPGDQLVADLGGDRGQALVAGEVGVVNQPAQRVGDLDRPHRVGVDLRGVVQVSQQMRGAQSCTITDPDRSATTKALNVVRDRSPSR